MARDRQSSDGTREVRLEGAGLIVVGGVLLAGVVGAFFLGRWVERRMHPPAALGAAQPGPLSQVVEVTTTEDTADDADFFDKAEAAGQALEPERELADPVQSRSAQPPPTPARATETSPSRTAAALALASDYYVQVFAGRDRVAAESLVNTLKKKGYVVRVFSEREGQGALFKVRVGGYESEQRAQLIAADLRKSGFDGAWVTRPE